ncbi:MAG: hypothetical protein QM650_17920 [Microlunatus sp.]
MAKGLVIDIDHVPTGATAIGRTHGLAWTLLRSEQMSFLFQRDEVDLLATIDDLEVRPNPGRSHLAHLPQMLKNGNHDHDRGPEHDDDAADQPNQSW